MNACSDRDFIKSSVIKTNIVVIISFDKMSKNVTSQYLQLKFYVDFVYSDLRSGYTIYPNVLTADANVFVTRENKRNEQSATVSNRIVSKVDTTHYTQSSQVRESRPV